MVAEITEEAAELVARVAALDIGKASLVACVRVPREDRPGRRRQEVRTEAEGRRLAAQADRELGGGDAAPGRAGRGRHPSVRLLE